MSKPRGGQSFGMILRDALDCPRGIRHGGGAKFNQALVRNVRTYTAMPREKAQAAPTARPKVPMRRLGADCFVVPWSEGSGSSPLGSGQPATGRTRQSIEGGSLRAVTRAV